jgi:hypothetical protein
MGRKAKQAIQAVFRRRHLPDLWRKGTIETSCPQSALVGADVSDGGSEAGRYLQVSFRVDGALICRYVVSD